MKMRFHRLSSTLLRRVRASDALSSFGFDVAWRVRASAIRKRILWLFLDFIFWLFLSFRGWTEVSCSLCCCCCWANRLKLTGWIGSSRLLCSTSFQLKRDFQGSRVKTFVDRSFYYLVKRKLSFASSIKFVWIICQR
jgi:hypothetical protein